MKFLLNIYCNEWSFHFIAIKRQRKWAESSNVILPLAFKHVIKTQLHENIHLKKFLTSDLFNLELFSWIATNQTNSYLKIDSRGTNWLAQNSPNHFEQDCLEMTLSFWRKLSFVINMTKCTTNLCKKKLTSVVGNIFAQM